MKEMEMGEHWQYRKEISFLARKSSISFKNRSFRHLMTSKCCLPDKYNLVLARALDHLDCL